MKKEKIKNIIFKEIKNLLLNECSDLTNKDLTPSIKIVPEIAHELTKQLENDIINAIFSLLSEELYKDECMTPDRIHSLQDQILRQIQSKSIKDIVRERIQRYFRSYGLKSFLDKRIVKQKISIQSIIHRRMSVAVIGEAQQGKSSLINNILFSVSHLEKSEPTRLAQVGGYGDSCTERTTCYSAAIGDGVDLFDIAGVGDISNASITDKTLIQYYRYYDLRLLLIRGHVNKMAGKIYKAMNTNIDSEEKYPLIVVWNAINEIRLKEDLDYRVLRGELTRLEALRIQIREILTKSFGTCPEFFLLDCRDCVDIKDLNVVIKRHELEPDDTLRLINRLSELSLSNAEIIKNRIYKLVETDIYRTSSSVITSRLENACLDVTRQIAKEVFDKTICDGVVTRIFESVVPRKDKSPEETDEKDAFCGKVYLAYNKRLHELLTSDERFTSLQGNLIQNIFNKIVFKLLKELSQKHIEYWSTKDKIKENAILNEAALVLGVICRLNYCKDSSITYRLEQAKRGYKSTNSRHKDSIRSRTSSQGFESYRSILEQVEFEIDKLVSSASSKLENEHYLKLLAPERSIIFKMWIQALINIILDVTSNLENKSHDFEIKDLDFLQHNLDQLANLSSVMESLNNPDIGAISNLPKDTENEQWNSQQFSFAKEYNTTNWIEIVIFFLVGRNFKECIFLREANNVLSKNKEVIDEVDQIVDMLNSLNKKGFTEKDFYPILRSHFMKCIDKIASQARNHERAVEIGLERNPQIIIDKVFQEVCSVALSHSIQEPKANYAKIIDLELFALLYDKYKAKISEFLQKSYTAIESNDSIINPIINPFVDLLFMLRDKNLLEQVDEIVQQLRQEGILLIDGIFFVNKHIYLEVGGNLPENFSGLTFDIASIKILDRINDEKFKEKPIIVQGLLDAYQMVCNENTIYITQTLYNTVRVLGNFIKDGVTPMQQMRKLFQESIRSYLIPSGQIRLTSPKNLNTEQINQCQESGFAITPNGIMIDQQFYDELVQIAALSKQQNIQEVTLTYPDIHSYNLLAKEKIEIQRQQLLSAFISKDNEQIKIIIAAGADIDMPICETGETLLIMAVRKIRPKLVSYLLSEGAKVYISGKEACNALSTINLAISKHIKPNSNLFIRALKIRKKLLEFALSQANAQGNLETITTLLYEDASPDVEYIGTISLKRQHNTQSTEYHNQSVPSEELADHSKQMLVSAFYKNDNDEIRTIIESGVDVNMPVGESGETLLLMSTKSIRISLVRYLLSKGARINTINRKECDCLASINLIISQYIILAHNKNLTEANIPEEISQIITKLLSCDKSQSQTIIENSRKILDKLEEHSLSSCTIDVGAKLLKILSDNNLLQFIPRVISVILPNAPLEHKLLRNIPEDIWRIRTMLINNGLLQAAKRGDFAEAANFLSLGADPNSLDIRNNTPLILASEIGCIEVVNILLGIKEIEINAQNIEGNTALMLSIYHGHILVARRLINENARLDLQNNRNLIASDFAKTRGMRNLCRILPMPVNIQIGKLEKLVGLYKVKEKIYDIIDIAIACTRGRDIIKQHLNIPFHMIFTGNPGTGKFTVAQLIANIYKELGIISTSNLIVVNKDDLVGRLHSYTTRKVIEKCKEAMATKGILFIDGSYSIEDNTDDNFEEAIDTLLSMIDHCDNSFGIIISSHKNQIKPIMQYNKLLNTKFNICMNFDDYTHREIFKILRKLTDDKMLELSIVAKDVVKTYIESIEDISKFGNGDGVVTYLDKAIRRRHLRIMGSHSLNKSLLEPKDFRLGQIRTSSDSNVPSPPIVQKLSNTNIEIQPAPAE